MSEDLDDEYLFDFQVNDDYGKENEEENEEDDHLFVQGVKQYEQMGTHDVLYEDDLG